jgi:hypothetical protein
VDFHFRATELVHEYVVLIKNGHQLIALPVEMPCEIEQNLVRASDRAVVVRFEKEDSRNDAASRWLRRP